MKRYFLFILLAVLIGSTGLSNSAAAKDYRVVCCSDAEFKRCNVAITVEGNENEINSDATKRTNFFNTTIPARCNERTNCVLSQFGQTLPYEQAGEFVYYYRCIRPGKNTGELLQDAGSELNPANLTDPKQLISRAIQLLFAFIGSIALVLYIYAGVLWFAAAGQSENISKAKKLLVWTTLGLVVMASSYALVQFVFSSLR